MGPRHAGAPHQHDGRGSWDEHASTYASQADKSEPGLRAATDALLGAVQAGPGVRLLDLACGPGHTTAAAHARGADVLGIDRSAAMIDQARQRFPAVSFTIGDMAIPPSGPWDAIMARFAAHHVDPAWLVAAFRVLRSGGRLAIAENQPAGPGDPSGKVAAPEWQRRLEQAGFTGVTAERCIVRLPDAGTGHLAGFRDGSAWIITGTKP